MGERRQGGAETRYSFSSNTSCCGDYAWDCENSGVDGNRTRFIAGRYLHHRNYVDRYGGLTHPLGQKMPNQFRLCNAYGNGWEWVSDWYAEG